ncbi:bifunctional 5,10-methylenetetrahydrofolate dehydrogenase/5,10-methenyltetrahydrofolate cyclohydrolase [Haloimpatiens sp. FM7315]|uniref:bifunctional 5,10-methylenetetrahydrofolate dehydrogenase/5,10-methenyltetrahydrofolate cyclohydrolase n=1 Tax=Haloimpatiens sp. FM7315 TaxID=3298609 RepID=UPI0035A29144
MGKVIKGKPVADSITMDLSKEVSLIKEKNIKPKLSIIRVGKNESDLAYERGIIKRCEGIGIEVEVKEYKGDINIEDFTMEINKVNEDDNTHGILIFRPLPKSLDENVVKYVIDPKKDMDCFSPLNVAKLMEGDETGFSPCTPEAVMEMLKYYNIDICGKNFVVVGRSMVVGKPVSMLLLKENATVTICHSKTKDLKEVTSKADVLVVGVGRPKFINSDYVKKGSVIIDVGINVDKEGNLCGDVDTEDCLKKAEIISKVPGGVGSVTTSVLAKHIIKACRNQNNI